jgi:hypothetical protein
VSAAPLGILAGVQFAAAFQFPEPGLVFQVALPAKAAVAAKDMSMITPWTALPLDSLRAGEGEARGVVFITRLVRHFRFMVVNPTRFGPGVTYRKA